MSSSAPFPSVSTARARGVIRPLRSDDIPALAQLYMSVFRGREGGSFPRLERHMRMLFLEHPRQNEDCVSLVYESGGGEIGGMFGSLPAPMLLDGRSVIGSIISTWMARPGSLRAEAGTRLVRAHLKRRHAISFTNTANATSVSMQESLRFRFSSHYSLEWFKALNLSSYAASVAARRAGARLPDWLARGLHAPERALRAQSRPQSPPGWRVEAVGVERFAELLVSLTPRFRLRPDWSAQDIVWTLNLAAERIGGGPLRLCEATDEKGRLAGVFAYFAPPMGRAETIELVAPRHGETRLLQALIADADAQRCAYVCGRAGPLIVRGLFETPRVYYRQTAAAAFRSDVPEIAAAVAYGEALLGGLIGDGWTPLATETYAP